MELDFKKEKQRVAGLSDAELVARLRDPAISATERMLVEAEITQRGLHRRQVPAAAPPPRKRSRRGANIISLFVFAAIALSILAGILEDMGIDIIQWLREFFDGAESAG